MRERSRPPKDVGLHKAASTSERELPLLGCSTSFERRRYVGGADVPKTRQGWVAPLSFTRASKKSMTTSHSPPTRTREQQIAYDLALVERIQGGDREAFQEIYRTYAPSLMIRISRMLGGNKERAEDCLQQVFAQALQSIQSYKGKNILHAWLNRLTTFVVMDEFRAQQGRQGFLQRFKWTMEPRIRESEAIPGDAFEQEEVKAFVQESLSKLNHKKRMVIVLCDLEGYSVEQAAAELNVPPGTVASRLHHARKELRTLMQSACRQAGLSVKDWFHV